MKRTERFDSADRIIRIGFWINAILMFFKLAAGYWGHSDAVFADGVESACDFVALSATMIALRMGRTPYDADHPYGHGRAENLAALLVSLVILSTGGWILYSSFTTLQSGALQTPGIIAIAAAVVTIALKWWLSRVTTETALALESPSLLAVARDHRKDALTSVATLVGVGGAFFGWGFLDPLAAGLTALFIIHVGYLTCREALHDLMDGSAPADYLDEMKMLAESVEGVEHVNDIRARRSGQYMIIDLKLDMDPAMTVKQSHDISIAVKRLIFEHNSSVGDVMIHIDPHDEEHEELTRL